MTERKINDVDNFKNISVLVSCISFGQSECGCEDETKKVENFADFDRGKHRENWENTVGDPCSVIVDYPSIKTGRKAS